MKILVLNCGSSSVKYRLFDDPSPAPSSGSAGSSTEASSGSAGSSTEASSSSTGSSSGSAGAASGSVAGRSEGGPRTLAKGLIERIGEPDGDAADHTAALQRVMESVDLTGLGAVGHRVVHGGPLFSAASIIDDKLVEAVESLVPLAPLHNPAALSGIAVARKLMPDVPQVAVFDTAFHQTIPPAGVSYAIDAALAERWQIRRYGFHGTSHAYVARQTAALLGLSPEDANVITLHLGNGASATAVQGGRSIATSMGMSPQSGLVMGTRSGDIDPTVIFHLHRVAGLPVDEIERSLTRQAGLQGLIGDNDMRTVERRREEGDPAATLAFDVYCRRIKEYVGAYMALLGRTDAIAFTAGVGEHSPEVRAASLAGLSSLGIEIDPARNAKGDRIISPDGSTVTVCVVPTDEELEIAQQTRQALGDS
ncbi:acetate kinase [Couchioplanes caeruleus]|uniref:acetate/propionate family kinase n=1 Tax=Couchioplanes caeruleus TaxID=56438 RepID=UPI0020C0EBA1|nr:acetate kinase [Couchioplanes caeruleus]UQU65967.1 acetate kinase [Couchioplanes caeruleus]